MNSVRIVLISVGMFGRAYIEEMTRRDVGGEIVGIVEPSEEAIRRCPTIAEKGWPVFRTVEEFYAAHTADLAIIVSPIHLHTQMTIYCMQHGSHVLCEKPLCLTREDALRMADCSRKTGKFLAVGYQLNYNRDVLAMKKDILAGRFGKPLRLRVMHAYSRGAAYYARNNWAGHILFNGNEVTDTAEALKHAKKSAADKASKSKLLQEADKQAKQIVETAYSPIAKADGYKVQVQLADK